MKKYSGAKSEKIASREQLPIGGYITKIMGAKEETFDWGSRLAIAFDISDGTHSEFFQKDFDLQSGEDKKWRGVFRVYEPKDDGSEKDEWTKKTFNNLIYSIEDSNHGYHFDWTPIENGDFSQLKGKLVGIIFRNEEWEMDINGERKTGWASRPFMAISTGDVKDGHFKMPKDKPLKNKQSAANTYSEIQDSSEEELPF